MTFKEDLFYQHYKNPFGKVSFQGESVVFKALNPQCGDSFEFKILITNSQTSLSSSISKIYFSGKGCTLSQVSASVLVKNFQEKTLEEAINNVKIFLSDVANRDFQESLIKLTDIEIFKTFLDFPLRINCLTFVWTSFDKFLKNLS